MDGHDHVDGVRAHDGYLSETDREMGERVKEAITLARQFVAASRRIAEESRDLFAAIQSARRE